LATAGLYGKTLFTRAHKRKDVKHYSIKIHVYGGEKVLATQILTSTLDREQWSL
jgi:hypothetical protein